MSYTDRSILVTIMEQDAIKASFRAIVVSSLFYYTVLFFTRYRVVPFLLLVTINSIQIAVFNKQNYSGMVKSGDILYMHTNHVIR